MNRTKLKLLHISFHTIKCVVPKCRPVSNPFTSRPRSSLCLSQMTDRFQFRFTPLIHALMASHHRHQQKKKKKKKKTKRFRNIQPPKSFRTGVILEETKKKKHQTEHGSKLLSHGAPAGQLSHALGV